MSEIEVHIDIHGGTRRVGTMRIIGKDGRMATTFQYCAEWLDFGGRFSLEPGIQVGAGIHTPGAGREMFSSLGDSAPDTWGRRLMQRMERRNAEREGRHVRTLMEIDYLLGVADVARMGALRFRRIGQEAFQTPLERGRAVPMFVELPRLLSVTEKVLRDEDTDEDLLLLFAPGSSLGGARPKASVLDRDGHLSIAKFPRDDDDYDIGAWEHVALTLAERAGIRVAEHRIEKVAGKTVMLSRRFDRDGGKRIVFLSAMAMMGLKDGDRGSYPELADLLRSHGSQPRTDAIELFRRMAFNILARNLDDHLRNHGFLWSGNNGWTLGPAYDLNPVPADLKSPMLSTNINLDEGTCSVSLALDSAEYFGLDVRKARAIFAEVAAAVSGWREVAQDGGIKPAEINRMKSAFEHRELREAMVERPVPGFDVKSVSVATPRGLGKTR
ncbi:MAG TPA: type II toxin-antitoxin system HipA family toxin [Rhodospirillaceae bacterium]|nr:type II toxin-antitoxin system HipA family toxin [Rhodospirillaceae bacterium]